MRSRRLGASFLGGVVVFGAAFGAGYRATDGARAAAVEVSDAESAALVGGGGYISAPFNCGFCSVWCLIGCPTTIVSTQTANAYTGNDQRVTTGLVPCGGAGWIYNCSPCIVGPIPVCNM